MDPKPDVIRHDIEETRSSLADKLETLEEQVKGTISNVSSSVEQTVEKVKSTVQDTVETVKRTFDLSYQVDRHPWAMAGCSLAAGMALGYLMGGRGNSAASRYARRDRYRPPATPPTAYGPGGSTGYEAASDYRREPEGPGMLSSLLAPLSSEIDKIKETAIAALMGMARDALVRAVPPALAERVQEIMDDLTRKAGGQPIREPLLPPGEH